MLQRLACGVPALEQPFLCSNSSRQIRNFNSSIAGALRLRHCACIGRAHHSRSRVDACAPHDATLVSQLHTRSARFRPLNLQHADFNLRFVELPAMVRFVLCCREQNAAFRHLNSLFSAATRAGRSETSTAASQARFDCDIALALALLIIQGQGSMLAHHITPHSSASYMPDQLASVR